MIYKDNHLAILGIIVVICWALYYTRSCHPYSPVMLLATITTSPSTMVKNATQVNPLWVEQLRDRELKVFSQNGEDGILLWIFANIGTYNSPPRYVEFGTENGDQCNTRLLRLHMGWQGLMMDGSNENSLMNLHKEIINPENINSLLEKYQTPPLLDLLSIDVDFDDYFVWKAILQANRFHARVVTIEYNYAIPPNENRVVDPNQDKRRWTGSDHYGASIRAMAALGRAHNYTLVYAEKQGVNIFFVRKDILVRQGILHNVPTVEQLHIKRTTTGWKHPNETDATRRWIWNDTLWTPD